MRDTYTAFPSDRRQIRHSQWPEWGKSGAIPGSGPNLCPLVQGAVNLGVDSTQARQYNKRESDCSGGIPWNDCRYRLLYHRPARGRPWALRPMGRPIRGLGAGTGPRIRGNGAPGSRREREIRRLPPAFREQAGPRLLPQPSGCLPLRARPPDSPPRTGSPLPTPSGPCLTN